MSSRLFIDSRAPGKGALVSLCNHATAAFAVLRRFKPVGVLRVPLGLFSCLKTALARSGQEAGAGAHLAALDAGFGRPAGGLLLFGRATTALRASVALAGYMQGG